MGALVTKNKSPDRDKSVFPSTDSFRRIIPGEGFVDEKHSIGGLVLELISAKGISLEVYNKGHISLHVFLIRKKNKLSMYHAHSAERYNTSEPVWHSFIPLCQNVSPVDCIRFELIVKYKRRGRTTKRVPIAKKNLQISAFYGCLDNDGEVDLVLKPFDEALDTKEITALVRKVEINHLDETLRKKVFFIRHGESLFNQAQSSKNLVSMFKQRNHPLSKEGIEQAKSFNKRWKTNSDSKDEFEKYFIKTPIIFSSPLNRALQTAIIALGDHPSVKKKGFKLLSSIREIQNFAGMDSMGTVYGGKITSSAFNHLSTQNLDLTNENTLQGTKVDPYDAVSEWWSYLPEEKQNVESRLRDFLRTIQYREEESFIVVSHSLIFKRLMQQCAFEPDEEDESKANLCNHLRQRKIPNLGCVCIEFEFGWPKPIENMETLQACSSSEYKSSTDSVEYGIEKYIPNQVENEVTQEVSSNNELFRHVLITNVKMMFEDRNS